MPILTPEKIAEEQCKAKIDEALKTFGCHFEPSVTINHFGQILFQFALKKNNQMTSGLSGMMPQGAPMAPGGGNVK